MAEQPPPRAGRREWLGLSGSTLMPSTPALLSTMFRDKAQRTFAISTWMATFMGGTAVGPLAGGALLEHFWWGSVFLMGAPVMLLLVLLGPLLLPESKTEDPGRIDVISVLLSLAGILTMVYGLKKGAEQGLEVVPFVFLGVGAVICLVFLRRQRRLTHPLLSVLPGADLAADTTLLLPLHQGLTDAEVRTVAEEFRTAVEHRTRELAAAV